jgi:hypothetical protein
VEISHFNLENITYCKILYISCTTKEGELETFYESIESPSVLLLVVRSILMQMFQESIDFKI